MSKATSTGSGKTAASNTSESTAPAPGETKSAAAPAPATDFASRLAKHGFREKNQQGEAIPKEEQDYATGWNGLHKGKLSATFHKGKKRVELSLAPNGASAPLQTVKVYDENDNVVFHSVGGNYPSEEYLSKFLGEEVKE